MMSCRQHGYPWPSLATSPYYSSPLAGFQGYIPNPYIAAVCMFELVVLLLLGHMQGSIGVYHWRVRPCFSSSVLRVWFVCHNSKTRRIHKKIFLNLITVTTIATKDSSLTKQKLENRNGKKKNCMYISSDQVRRWDTGRLGQGLGGPT